MKIIAKRFVSPSKNDTLLATAIIRTKEILGHRLSSPSWNVTPKVVTKYDKRGDLVELTVSAVCAPKISSLGLLTEVYVLTFAVKATAKTICGEEVIDELNVEEDIINE